MNNCSKLHNYHVEIDKTSNLLDKCRLNITYFANRESNKTSLFVNVVVSSIKIIYITKGECICTINDRRYKMQENDIIIIPPYSLHSADCMSPSLISCEIHFNIEPIIDELRFLSFFNINSPKYIKDGTNDYIKNLINTCISLEKTTKYALHYQLQNLIIQTILNTCAVSESQDLLLDHSKECKMTNNLLTFIAEHIYEKLTVQDCCDYFNVSQSYLYRCTKKALNCSTMDLINSNKLIVAKRMLLDNDYNITEISEKLGFSSTYYFSRLFKNTFGISPSQFKQMYS